MLGAGTILDGRFEIEEIIGRGGMGAVYRAQDKHSGKIVAIKELLVHLENPYEKESAIKQFEREAKMLVRLSHPGIPEQLGYFVSEESAYLAMEFIEGTTLESIVCENEELPAERTVIEWGMQLCDVLDYLHELTPIIFRDLKPSNVMQAGNQIKLIDFGIAKRLDPIMQTASILKGSGTPGYAPMEQYGKGSTDPRSDVYSLGATLYFLLTGRDPPQSVDIASGVDVLVPPRAYNPEISEAMEAAILRMMALKKEDRYQTAGAASEVLEACKSSMGLTVIRIPPRQTAPKSDTTPAASTNGTDPPAPVSPPMVEPRRASVKLPPIPARDLTPRRSSPWKAATALVVLLVVAAATWLLLRPHPVVLRVVVDDDQAATSVEKTLAPGLTWTRTASTRPKDVPGPGFAVEVPASDASDADSMVKSLGAKLPSTVITRAGGGAAIRLTQNFGSSKEAAARQKEVAKKLGRPAEVVHRAHPENVPVVILETTVSGASKAEALKKDLETHQVDVSITPPH